MNPNNSSAPGEVRTTGKNLGELENLFLSFSPCEQPFKICILQSLDVKKRVLTKKKRRRRSFK